MKALCIALFLSTLSCTTTHQFPSVLFVRSVRGSGSAVPVMVQGGKLWSLTARHLLPVTSVGNRPVLDQRPHPFLDLAMISTKARDVRVAPLAARLPVLGDRLVAVGWHLGRVLLVTDGRQGGTTGSMSCPIIFGVSGGAVLNQRGELVGIAKAIFIVGRYHPISHVAQYVPVVGLRTWIIDQTR